MTENAARAFTRLLRDVVAPALRAQGLQGSGQTYVLPHAGSWALVGFQKSTTSTAEAVKFTINLKVTDKEWWDEQRRNHAPLKDRPPPGVDRETWDARRLEESAYPVRPSANTSDDGRWIRIGDAVPGGHADRWWVLTAADAEEVVGDALAALIAYGIPWLRAQLTP